MSIAKIKGFNDIFSPETELFGFIENKAAEIFSLYGCRELRIPVVEYTELFVRGIGEETDVVQKEMFTFQDRKGRSLTLRPEATAGVIRAYIEAKLHARDDLVKLFTIGPMFRYERPQKGRQRQFNQLNVEFLGSASPLADAELILMLKSFLKEIGLHELSFELNSLGCRECRPNYRQALTDFFSRLDANLLCEDCERRMTANPLRVLDCKVESCRKAVAFAPNVAEYNCPACREHFESVLDVLDRAGITYNLNPRLVRGLDYYQRTTFEVQSMNIGAQTAVAGGGRYDGLVRDLGGPDVPGVGFACGMERLAMLANRPRDKKTDFYLAVLEESALANGLLLAEKLRARGFRGECALQARSLKSSLRHAGRLEAEKCLILGREEAESSRIAVKDMKSGGQFLVNWDELADIMGKMD